MVAVDPQEPADLLHDLEERHWALLDGIEKLEERVDQVLRQWGAARAGSERIGDLSADPVGPSG